VTKIHQWSELAPDFRDSIILGNGASSSVSTSFSYSSLFDWASEKKLFTPDVRKVFKHLNNTKDFEFVLRILWHATHVNRALRVKEKVTENTYKKVQAALIRTVHDTHVKYQDTREFLFPIEKFLKRFSTVISLNYDLIVYWAMLVGNEQHGTWFKDCFVNEQFDYDWEKNKLRDPYGRASGSTLVFYPHGNLALVSDLTGIETKVHSAGSSSLLKTVIEKWKSGKYSPVFVSEGTSPQKVAAIRRSSYLDTVYKSVIPKLGPTLTIYGWSLSDADDHIVGALPKGEICAVAISVHKAGGQVEEKVQLMKNKIKNALGQKTKVWFFDSTSPGCWKEP
jgi:hypothetical protein